MADIRDFGIAVSDAIRLNDCLHELTEYVTARPPCPDDKPMWTSKASASPGNDDWVHRTNSRNVAEVLLRAAIRDRRFNLWIRLAESESLIDPYAMKEVSHRTLAAGAYLEINEGDSFLAGRPLWVKSRDWRPIFATMMQERYGEATFGLGSPMVQPHRVDEALSSFLTILAEDARIDFDRIRNDRQARLGQKGLTGGSDYVAALCDATKVATVRALERARDFPVSSLHASQVAIWAFALFDELAIISRKHCDLPRIRLQSNRDLADKLHAEGRMAVDREIMKWQLELAVPDLSEVVGAPKRPAAKVARNAARPVGDKPLQRWWQSLGARADSMTQAELLQSAGAKFPNNHISRQRIRDLTGARKTGPKPIRRKLTAE